MRKLLLFLIIGFFLLNLVSASRLPIVDGDEDSWGTILNDLLSRIAGNNATELNLTMVNGTNIYSSAINSTHIADNTIAASDIGLDVIDGSELADTITLDAMLNFINNSFAVNTSDLFVNVSSGYVGIGTNNPGVALVIENADSRAFNFDFESSNPALLETGGTGLVLGSGNRRIRLTDQSGGAFYSSSGSVSLGLSSDRWSGLYTTLITDNGSNVGIGTSSPGSTLEINGTISIPGSGTSSEQFGLNANASALGTVAIGNGANASSDYSTIIGTNAKTGTGLSAVAIGYEAFTGSGNGATAIGKGASAQGVGAFALGAGTVADGNSAVSIGGGATSGNRNYGIAIGSNADASGGNGGIALGVQSTSGGVFGIALGLQTTSAANTFVAGANTSSLYGIYDVYFGNGIIFTDPTALTIHGTGGNGINITGGNLVFAGGKGTGAGSGGDIVFQTSDTLSNGTTLQSLTTKAIIKNTGFVGINTTTPQNTLNVVGNLNATQNSFFGQNVTISECILFDSGGKICSGS